MPAHAHRLAPDRRPSGSRRPGHRLPGSRPSAPSPPSAAAPGSRESSCPCAAWGCAVRPCRRASPSPGRDSRCAGRAGRRSLAMRRRRSWRRPPTPSAARRQSRSYRARKSASGAFSTSARRFIISSVIGGSSVCVGDSQPEPTEKPPMTAASRSLATALWRARFASGLLRRCYTTNRDTTSVHHRLGSRSLALGASIG